MFGGVGGFGIGRCPLGGVYLGGNAGPGIGIYAGGLEGLGVGDVGGL